MLQHKSPICPLIGALGQADGSVMVIEKHSLSLTSRLY